MKSGKVGENFVLSTASSLLCAATSTKHAYPMGMTFLILSVVFWLRGFRAIFGPSKVLDLYIGAGTLAVVYVFFSLRLFTCLAVAVAFVLLSSAVSDVLRKWLK